MYAIYYVFCVIIIILLVTTYVLLFNKPFRTKAFVINLEKNNQRLERFNKFYQASDLVQNMPVTRYNAVNGRELDIQSYMTPFAYKELLHAEKVKYRTMHYQTTRGGVGCYLSHTNLFKMLLEDPNADFYIIFEDDAIMMPKIYNKLKAAVLNAPKDWDMIVFAPITQVVSDEIGKYRVFDYFWGLSCYAIRKEGARKFVEEFNRKAISMQIDSKMSAMVLNGKFKVYGYKDKIVWHGRAETDIQLPLRRQPGVNPFELYDA